MSESLIPGRPRAFSHRDDLAPRSTLARHRVDLGHAWSKKPISGARMHVVRRDGDRWVLVCSGRRATREYLGYAANATCSECKRAGVAE